jgi:hypothetical protein
MAGCKVGCIQITEPMTNREIWDYVRTFYFGDFVDTRHIADPARVAYELYLDSEFSEDETKWSSVYGHVKFERFLQWKYTYGTTQYGNLPEHKKSKHVGHCYAPCPYSTQSDDMRTRLMLGLPINAVVPTKVDHTVGGKIYYMRTEGRGTSWGYECTFPSCPYYLANGERYFHV